MGIGELCEVGVKLRQIYKMGNCEVEFIEIIIVYNLFEEFVVIYEVDGVWNFIENCFIELGEVNIKWIFCLECKFLNVFMRLLVFVVLGIFRK